MYKIHLNIVLVKYVVLVVIQQRETFRTLVKISVKHNLDYKCLNKSLLV